MLVQVLEGQRVKEYGIQTIFLDPLSPIVRPLFAHCSPISPFAGNPLSVWLCCQYLKEARLSSFTLSLF
jgi:hypothetical protein